jgi:hypothetical protein
MIDVVPANVSLEPKFRFQYTGFQGTNLRCQRLGAGFNRMFSCVP